VKLGSEQSSEHGNVRTTDDGRHATDDGQRTGAVGGTRAASQLVSQSGQPRNAAPTYVHAY